MNPSQENKHDPPPASQKTTFIPAILVLLLLVAITGLGFFFYSDSVPIALDTTKAQPPKRIFPLESQTPATTTQQSFTAPKTAPKAGQALLPKNSLSPALSKAPATTENDLLPTDHAAELPAFQQNVPAPSPTSDVAPEPQTPQRTVESICKAAEKRLHTFYSGLDKQPYMSQYQLLGSSEQHFTALIHKLLNNPPQVTRESDDLYTILKNTAHFFRVSGKDNILMMKGILGNEKQHIEQILADYDLLISTPECATRPQVAGMNQEALYEYACFFLNTMGGRLYLFRRDSLSRMVVTYYAILLVDRANQQNNNNHGLDLKSFVDMLIAEMESGGSSLTYQDRYLDSLYLMKEKYQ